MSEPAIHVDGLGKCYRIWTHHRPTNLKERAATLVRGRRERTPLREEIWALRNVSFDVARGEVLGVIGANGAGKSTLFSVLARITEPTEGYAEIRGRVSALLEVGTGFHLELIGRDNIFLNGAILGMSRAETRRKFDEIVDFAELREFIDMPVKRYSTGMYMRLAFAVAAHLDPEILLLDEVLSVGDVAFQQKSLERIQEITRSGRTVLFVSHTPASVAQLCDRVVYLDHGRVQFVGPTDEGLDLYIGSKQAVEGGGSLRAVPREGTGEVIVASARVAGADGGDGVYPDQPVSIRVELSARRPFPARQLRLDVVISSPLSGTVVTLATKLGDELEYVEEGTVVECLLDELPLQPGTYHVSLGIGNVDTVLDQLTNQIELHVLPPDAPMGGAPIEHPGPVLVRQRWRVGEREPVEGVR